MNIVIVDYGLGNLRSVQNAFALLGADAKISSTPSEVGNADKLVLPGVGSFQDAVEGLRKRKLIEPIKKFIASGRVYLGICLGLQLLYEESEEGKAKGLSVFKGKVRRFKKKANIKIPHIGWNSVDLKKIGEKLPPMQGVKDASYFYFVHSYYAEPDDENTVAATTEYGDVEFTSMISKGNVFATQFHPERSQEVGLKFLKNFIEM